MSRDTKTLFQEFENCFFCQKRVRTDLAEYMFQGRPVCKACQQARKYVAYLCTPIKPYLGVDPDWRSQMNPTKKNTGARR